MNPFVAAVVITLLSMVFFPPSPPTEWVGFVKLGFALIVTIVAWVLFVISGAHVTL